MKYRILTCTFLFLISLFLTIGCEAQRSNDVGLTTSIDSQGRTVYPCTIPNEYSYPEGTNDFYKKSGIWLSNEFVRPDLIWVADGSAADFIDGVVPAPGTVWTVADPIWNHIGSDSARFAVRVKIIGTYDLSALIRYLTDLGWETLSDQEPHFSATRQQINSLDCTSLQTALGVSTQSGIYVTTLSQQFHSHDEIEGEENYTWNCSHNLYGEQ